MATYPPAPTRPESADADTLAGEVVAAPVRQQRLAWLVLWLSFASFVALSGTALAGVRGFLASATDSRPGTLTTIGGTVLVRHPRQAQWVSAGPETVLEEGHRVRTDGVSQAFITLFDRSTVQVFTGTELEVTRSAVAPFGGGRQVLELTLREGKVHLGVAPQQQAPREVRLTTRHGYLTFSEGSYTVSVDGTATRVRVAERGAAVAAAGGATVALSPGARADLHPDGPRLLGVGQEELVYNGDFAQGLEGWRAGHVAGYLEGMDLPGSYELVVDEGRVAARFLRRGSRGTHSETLLAQDLDKDVSDYTDLRLSLDIKLKHQSLSGGGYQGSEYPVLVRLTYRSATSEPTAAWGFYYQNVDNNRTDLGTQVPRDAWVRYTVPVNLMTLNPPPQRLLSLQVSASGHDYESLVANVSLTAQ